MEDSKLIKFAKFYTKLDAIRSEMRDAVDLGYHLDIDVKFLNKLDASIENIDAFLIKRSEIFEK